MIAGKINLTGKTVEGTAAVHMDNFMSNTEAGRRFARGDSGESSDASDSETGLSDYIKDAGGAVTRAFGID